MPKAKPAPTKSWGPACIDFLKAVNAHTSKASAGYYYSTHLDYFDKMARSLVNIHAA